ncbi:hypothetical protein [Actinocrispum sp. NPDC049592]|uniref:hypothetical protein n=1 Tax=Actinocrispum sp. NPDC049592 TaxID=3154835 RepID=UPI003448560E
MSPGSVRPRSWVEADVLADGVLELSAGAGGVLFRCGPAGTAMWIALCQHGWLAEGAVGALSAIWTADRENIRAELDIWIGELWDAGLLEQR